MIDTQKTKKLINDADHVIEELIDGMVGAHPEMLCVEGATGRAVVSIKGPREGKVGIVVGGGSGHEPAFSGYVGKGLADASAVGNVFASPSPEQIMDAARAADGGAGVLFLYGNYTGDVMNFDMAVEELGSEGIKANSITVTDDVASAKIISERRGIAGTFFVFKCAGAAADLDYSMDEVELIARHANAMTRSAGVALGACSLPQTRRPNFEIGPDEMEVGMGIHGEPGISRTTLEPANAVADRLMDLIVADIEFGKGDRVAVLVNGLGSTSLMELYILHRQIRSRLCGLGVSLYQSWVGNYVTSLEMAGASVTVMKLDDQLIKMLDHPCETAALQVGEIKISPNQRPRRRSHAPMVTKKIESDISREDLIAEGDVTPEIFRRMLLRITEQIGENKGYLCELDGVIGDADHGIAMDVGWRAIRDGLSEDEVTISVMCAKAGKNFLDAVGASVGPLYGTAFQRASKAVNDRLNLDSMALVSWLDAIRNGIVDLGGAAPGDKTMVDAWTPAVEHAAREQEAGGSIIACLQAACDGAEKGKNATVQMKSKKGRSAKLGLRSLGHVDPGAASVVVILNAMREVVEEEFGDRI
ncbi:MAG: dihydroxyacetone kinase subunit DhaL [Rhizobiaceae bacterium]